MTEVVVSQIEEQDRDIHQGRARQIGTSHLSFHPLPIEEDTEARQARPRTYTCGHGRSTISSPPEGMSSPVPPSLHVLHSLCPQPHRLHLVYLLTALRAELL